MTAHSLSFGALRRALSTRISWTVLIATTIALLAFGSVHSPTSPNIARINYLESVLKCPSCADLSVAQSDAQQAKDLRVSITSWVNQGWSNAKIENTIVNEFGADELLSPSGSGVDVLAWVLPIVGVVLAAGSVAVVLIRRRRGGVVAYGLDEDEALVDLARMERSRE